MENTEQNSQDNGLEILNKVIETNEANIEQSVKLLFAHEDILNLIAESEFTLRCIFENIQKAEAVAEIEKKRREEFLERIPKTIEAKLSEDSIQYLKEFDKKSKAVKYMFFGSVVILLLAIISIFSIGKLAKNWYFESAKTKSEIRQEIFTEIQNDGKSIYKTSDIEPLKNNTLIMNKWIQKNPKDSENFLKFKEGFESR